MPRVSVKYMMWLIDRMGTREEQVDLPGEATLRDLVEFLAERKHGRAREILLEILGGKSELIVLINSQTPRQGLNTKIKDGDTVIFIPPVSGGVI